MAFLQKSRCHLPILRKLCLGLFFLPIKHHAATLGAIFQILHQLYLLGKRLSLTRIYSNWSFVHSSTLTLLLIFFKEENQGWEQHASHQECI